jgi:hypothetical protein
MSPPSAASPATGEAMSDSDGKRQPRVSGSYPAVTEQSGLRTQDGNGVIVIVTQAFDGHGNNLVHPDGPTFDGFPGVTLQVEAPDGRSASVTLSPIHGDPRKVGFEDLEAGTRCRLRAHPGAPELELEGPCGCAGDGNYYRLYLSERGTSGEVCLICDIWGCHRSRIIDDSDLLSWVDY